jgi:hypothetical protein
MKLETLHNIATEFVGLRSKMYFLKVENGENKKTAKGVKKSVKDNILTHQDYIDTLMQEKSKTISQYTIRSYNYKVYSISQTKIGLSPVNDKKYLLEDGLSGYSYGHFKINI